MRRERTEFFWRCIAMVMCAALLSGIAWAATDPTRLPPGRPTVASHPRPDDRAPRTKYIARTCLVHADCDDSEPCTVDVCSKSQCTHSPIPSCTLTSRLPACEQVDVVIVMDTSGTMKDEGAALCAAIDAVEADLLQLGVTARTTLLGIVETPGSGFECLDNTVVSLLGDTVPGDAASCPFPDGSAPYESWGPAAAIVANRFDWLEDAPRVIIPISDEGPCNGHRPDGCNDPGDDRDSIANAVSIANANGVVVSTLAGSGSDECVLRLAQDLATGTCGTIAQTAQAGEDLPGAIAGLVLASCEPAACDDDDFCTRNDVCVNGVCAGTDVPGCKPCTASGFCSDGNACTDDVCLDFDCVTTPNFDEDAVCCDPETGALAPLDDGNDCTVPVCDVETGLVMQTPIDDGSSCDDGLFCTDNDTCNDGMCMGGPLHDCSELNDPCNMGACNFDADACVSVPANEEEPCDDGLFCTDGETCQGGVCGGGAPHDCGNLLDCTDDMCDETADRCVNVIQDGNCVVDGTCFLDGELRPGNDCERCAALEQPGEWTPLPTGTSCDDDAACTIEDQCNGQGVCIGTSIGNLSCTTSDDCFGGACHIPTGLCRCNELELVAVPGVLPVDCCYARDEEISVHVVLEAGTDLIRGGQFLIGFDSSVIEIVNVLPGVYADTGSQFVFELHEQIDNASGRLFYAVGIDPFSGRATRGPAIMAVIRFRPVQPCALVEPMCFLNGNPEKTTLTDLVGGNAPVLASCSKPLNINGEQPTLNCPSDAEEYADAGRLTALITWQPIVAESDCGGPAELQCTVENSAGAKLDSLIPSGGLIPTGLSSFQCTATDQCGATRTCDWQIRVHEQSSLQVGFEFEQPFADQRVTRCIELELFKNCAEQPVLISEAIPFGTEFQGLADGITLTVPAGRYVCATARDPLHTLRSVDIPATIDGEFVLSFVGDPFFGGNWLLGGNLDGNRVIDQVDAAIFLIQESQVVDPNTPCDTVGPHADINGDGIVDALDFSFIEANLTMQDKDSCCPTTTSTLELPVRSISVRELESRGLHEAAAADLNHDGVVDARDLAAFRRGVRAAKPGRPSAPSDR